MDEKRFMELFPEAGNDNDAEYGKEHKKRIWENGTEKKEDEKKKDEKKREEFFEHIKMQIQSEKPWELPRALAQKKRKDGVGRKKILIYSATAAACLILVIVLPNLSGFLRLSEKDLSEKDTAIFISENSHDENNQDALTEPQGNWNNASSTGGSEKISDDDNFYDDVSENNVLDDNNTSKDNLSNNTDDKTSGNKTSSDKASGNKTSSDKTSNNKTGDDKTVSSNEAGEEKYNDGTLQKNNNSGTTDDFSNQGVDTKKESNQEQSIKKDTKKPNQKDKNQGTKPQEEKGEQKQEQTENLENAGVPETSVTDSEVADMPDTTIDPNSKHETNNSVTTKEDIDTDAEDDAIILDNSAPASAQVPTGAGEMTDFDFNNALNGWWEKEQGTNTVGSGNTYQGEDQAAEETTETTEITEETTEETITSGGIENDITKEEIEKKLRTYPYLYYQDEKENEHWYQERKNVQSNIKGKKLLGNALIFKEKSLVLDQKNAQQNVYIYGDEKDLSVVFVRFQADGEDWYYEYKQ